MDEVVKVDEVEVPEKLVKVNQVMVEGPGVKVHKGEISKEVRETELRFGNKPSSSC